MPDSWSVWSVGASAAAHALRAQGYSPREADCLVALRQRRERGDFRELTSSQKRLEFARWLVEHRRLTDYGETAETATYGEPRGLPGAPCPTHGLARDSWSTGASEAPDPPGAGDAIERKAA